MRVPPWRPPDAPTRFLPSLCLALCFMALGLAGCAPAARRDFPAIFSMLATADEALDALQPPKRLQLQDDMVLYAWEGRKDTVVPAHTEYVRSRWPRRDGFFEYYEIWVPDTTYTRYCAARIITDPDGVIVYRTWRGNACESFVRHFPAWYDRDNPGIRRGADRPEAAPGGTAGTPAAGEKP